MKKANLSATQACHQNFYFNLQAAVGCKKECCKKKRKRNRFRSKALFIGDPWIYFFSPNANMMDFDLHPFAYYSDTIRGFLSGMDSLDMKP